MHPPSGSHSRNKDAGSIEVGAYRMTDPLDGDRLENLLESDYIYFDSYRDVEFVRVINDVTWQRCLLHLEHLDLWGFLSLNS